MFRRLFVVAISFVLAPEASGLSFVSQSRTVEVEVEVVIDGPSLGDDDSASAPGTGPWSSGALSVSFDPGAGDFAYATGSQDGDLQVTPGVIQAGGVGLATSHFDIWLPGTPTVSRADASSRFELVFTLAAPAFVSLDWTLVAGLDSRGGTAVFVPTASVLLEGGVVGPVASDEAADTTTDAADVMASDAFAGVLAPGTYTLTVEAVAHGMAEENGWGTGDASFDFTFVVPEPSPTVLIAVLALFVLRRRA